uniref:Orcokinin B n=1 Tax=Plautia stali TaxID=106108 RepID=A0A1E1G7T4_PLAST|nr:orcokinin B [Plautia stali]
MSPIVFSLAIIVCVSAAQPLRNEMASEELYPGFPHESAYEEAKQMRNLDSIEFAANYKELMKQLDRSAWMRGGTLDSIGGGHLVRDLDGGVVRLRQNYDDGPDGHLDTIGGGHLLRNLDSIGGGHLVRNLDSIGGGHLVRNLDSIGGGHLVRNLDSIGGGHLVRNLDSIGGGHLVRNFDSIGGGHLIRNLDSIGGGHLVRNLDSLGGGHLVRNPDAQEDNLIRSYDEVEGHLDTLGGGHLLRSLDTIGGGHLVRDLANLSNDRLARNAKYESNSDEDDSNNGINPYEKSALGEVNKNEDTRRVRRSEN